MLCSLTVNCDQKEIKYHHYHCPKCDVILRITRKYEYSDSGSDSDSDPESNLVEIMKFHVHCEIIPNCQITDYHTHCDRCLATNIHSHCDQCDFIYSDKDEYHKHCTYQNCILTTAHIHCESCPMINKHTHCTICGKYQTRHTMHFHCNKCDYIGSYSNLYNSHKHCDECDVLFTNENPLYYHDHCSVCKKGFNINIGHKHCGFCDWTGDKNFYHQHCDQLVQSTQYTQSTQSTQSTQFIQSTKSRCELTSKHTHCETCSWIGGVRYRKHFCKNNPNTVLKKNGKLHIYKEWFNHQNTGFPDVINDIIYDYWLK